MGISGISTPGLGAYNPLMMGGNSAQPLDFNSLFASFGGSASQPLDLNSLFANFGGAPTSGFGFNMSSPGLQIPPGTSFDIGGGVSGINPNTMAALLNSFSGSVPTNNGLSSFGNIAPTNLSGFGGASSLGMSSLGGIGGSSMWGTGSLGMLDALYGSEQFGGTGLSGLIGMPMTGFGMNPGVNAMGALSQIYNPADPQSLNYAMQMQQFDMQFGGAFAAGMNMSPMAQSLASRAVQAQQQQILQQQQAALQQQQAAALQAALAGQQQQQAQADPLSALLGLLGGQGGAIPQQTPPAQADPLSALLGLLGGGSVSLDQGTGATTGSGTTNPTDLNSLLSQFAQMASLLQGLLGTSGLPASGTGVTPVTTPTGF